MRPVDHRGFTRGQPTAPGQAARAVGAVGATEASVMSAADAENILRTVAQITAVPVHFLRHGGNRPLFAKSRAVAVLALRRAGFSWRKCAEALGRSASSVVELARTYEHDDQVCRDVERCSEIHGSQNQRPNSPAHQEATP